MIPLQHAPYQTRPGEWGSGFLKFRIPKRQYFRSTITSNSLIRQARQEQRNKFQLLNAFPTLGLCLNYTGFKAVLEGKLKEDQCSEPVNPGRPAYDLYEKSEIF